MSEASHLAESLSDHFSTPNYYWFVSYPAIVAGLTAQQAGCAPGPRFNSIWQVTLHLAICQRFALAVLRGDAIDMREFFPEGAWPPVHDPGGQAAWEQAKNDLLAANHNLAAYVARIPDEILDQELPVVNMKVYGYIHGHLAHNSHHLNEMICIRHMQGLWFDKT
jgi:hypothetical protein